MLVALLLAKGPEHQPTIANESSSKQTSLDTQINNLEIEYNVSNANRELIKRIMGCETMGSATATPDPTKYRLNRRKDGSVWSTDLGYWQINDYYWDSFFKKMGLDIHKPQDNLRAGFWIFQHNGTQPWVWSKHCWQTKKLT